MARVMDYQDPVSGCFGYLVYDQETCRLSAGGLRVQSGLNAETLTALASRMTLKQRILGINVDGAKAGLDYDPLAPGSEAALQRFLAFLGRELSSRLSLGSDVGTRFSTLEKLAPLPSIKYAVKAAQGFTDAEFFARLRVLSEPAGLQTLGQRRAGHACAASALTAAAYAGLKAHGLRCTIQGFGTLGRAAAESLTEAGATIVAIADEHGCVSDPSALDVPQLLSQAVLPVQLPSEALFDIEADVLVLAGAQDALTSAQADALPVAVVVVGANCGLSEPIEEQLHQRGVLTVPDFVGGIGGSASMETLFGATTTLNAREVLDRSAFLVRELVSDVLTAARDRRISPRTAALQMADTAPVAPTQRPYGHSPYLSDLQPKGNRAALSRTGGNR